LKSQNYAASRLISAALFCGVRFSIRHNHGIGIITVAGFTTGMILGLFLLGSLRRPVPSWAALVGLVIGFIVVFLIWLPPLWGNHRLAWPWYAPIGTVTTVVIALIVSVLGSQNGSSANRGAEPGLDKIG
jgi:Na+/proline symporter